VEISAKIRSEVFPRTYVEQLFDNQNYLDRVERRSFMIDFGMGDAVPLVKKVGGRRSPWKTSLGITMQGTAHHR
jgi:hypothetical protein